MSEEDQNTAMEAYERYRAWTLLEQRLEEAYPTAERIPFSEREDHIQLIKSTALTGLSEKLKKTKKKSLYACFLSYGVEESKFGRRVISAILHGEELLHAEVLAFKFLTRYNTMPEHLEQALKEQGREYLMHPKVFTPTGQATCAEERFDESPSVEDVPEVETDKETDASTLISPEVVDLLDPNAGLADRADDKASLPADGADAESVSDSFVTMNTPASTDYPESHTAEGATSPGTQAASPAQLALMDALRLAVAAETSALVADKEKLQAEKEKLEAEKEKLKAEKEKLKAKKKKLEAGKRNLQDEKEKLQAELVDIKAKHEMDRSVMESLQKTMQAWSDQVESMKKHG